MVLNRFQMTIFQEIGLPLDRIEVSIDSDTPHDETFSYELALKFYGMEKQLSYAIKKANQHLKESLKIKDKKRISNMFSIIGNLYYIKGDYKTSAGYFMQSIDHNKKDLTNWVELLFAIRAMGNFELFEKAVFNLRQLYLQGQNSSRINQQSFTKLVNKVALNGK